MCYAVALKSTLGPHSVFVRSGAEFAPNFLERDRSALQKFRSAERSSLRHAGAHSRQNRSGTNTGHIAMMMTLQQALKASYLVNLTFVARFQSKNKTLTTTTCTLIGTFYRYFLTTLSAAVNS